MHNSAHQRGIPFINRRYYIACLTILKVFSNISLLRIRS